MLDTSGVIVIRYTHKKKKIIVVILYYSYIPLVTKVPITDIYTMQRTFTLYYVYIYITDNFENNENTVQIY